ncbi:MAG: permease [Rhodothermales bacterium]|nr:permease [Rhodothermales bacterium]
MFLAASLIALLLGPLLYRIFEPRRHFYEVLDGFVVVVITGIVVLELLPDVMGEGLFWSILFVLLGLVGPTLLEKAFHRAENQVHRAALMLGLIGLVLHSFLDGIALRDVPAMSGAADTLLPLGVAVHTVPVALTIWWLLFPRFGAGLAGVFLGLMGAGTVAGYIAGPELEPMLAGLGIALFRALVAGSILHVIFHRPHVAHEVHDHSHHHAHTHTHRFHWFEGAGNLLGLGVLGLLILLHFDTHGAEEEGIHALYESVARTFWSLALESAPALLLAYMSGGLIMAFLPKMSVRWMRGGRPLGQALKGMAVGLPLPICTCGVLPLYRTLIRQGAPPAAAMAFLIATPELGIDALLISIPLLGGDMTIVRLAAAATIALVVGWGVGTIASRMAPPALDRAEAEKPPESWPIRLRAGLKEGFGGLVDDTAPWILVGLLIAAIAQPVLAQGWLSALSGFAEVALFALVGLPIYVCASGATPIVAVLLVSGVSPGAALAFLLTGPATNISTFGILSALHGRRIALLFGAATAVTAILLGHAVNTWLGGMTLLTAAELDLDQSGWLQHVSVVVLMALFLASLVRRGARAFMGEVFASFKYRSAHATQGENAGCAEGACGCAS